MGKRILVVDDEKPIRELLKHKLGMKGFDVILAKNEKEFSDMALNQKPDIIILDIWLKDKIGTNIYNKLLNNGLDPSVPVIFITALVAGQPKELPSEFPGRRYALFSKPFDFEKLAHEIDFLLNDSSAKQAEASRMHGVL